MSEAFPQTAYSWRRLKRTFRVYVTLHALDWAAKSLGKLGYVEAQISVMKIITKTY